MSAFCSLSAVYSAKPVCLRREILAIEFSQMEHRLHCPFAQPGQLLLERWLSFGDVDVDDRLAVLDLHGLQRLMAQRLAINHDQELTDGEVRIAMRVGESVGDLAELRPGGGEMFLGDAAYPLRCRRWQRR